MCHLVLVKQTSQQHNLNAGQIIQSLGGLTYQMLGAERRFNCKYFKSDINKALLFTATNETYLEEGAYELRAITGDSTPSPDVIFNTITPVTSKEWIDRFNKLNDKLIKRAEKRGLLNGPLILAGDTTLDPWFGDANHDWVIGTMDFRGTYSGYGFVTVEVVQLGERFTLGVLPINQLCSKERAIKDLLLKILKKHDIGVILLDRGFFNFEMLKWLLEQKIHFIMPIPRNGKVKDLLDEAKPYRYRIFSYSMSKGKEEISFTTVIMDSTKNRKESVTDDGRFIFATDTEMLTEPELFLYSKTYNSRWGIETGYRIKDRFLIHTTTSVYSVRVFFFLLSVAIYNLWVIINAMKKMKNPDRYEYWVTTTQLKIIIKKACVMNLFRG